MHSNRICINNKFRLYPSKNQESVLVETLELCRQTYNYLLHELNNQKIIDRAQIQGIIPDMKICNPKLKNVYSRTLQYECYRLFSNLRALSRTKYYGRKVGALRFKGKGWFKTFTYNQSGFKLIKSGRRLNMLMLSKVGEIPIRCHRKIKGNIKQITIKREASGKWFAFILEERFEDVKSHPIRKIVGIDVGLKDIIYDSDGNKITNPRHLKKHAKKLAHSQRKLNKKKKGSNNRFKARIKTARQYEKINNIRNDFLHKLSHCYVSNYDVIAMEELQIIDMVKNHNLSKSILDASWGKLKQMISYKAENAGKRLILVDPKGTTQRCSQCGKIVPKKLRDRIHKCNCGFIVPRDYNSALEIRRLALQEIGQELSESTPMEMLVGASMK